MERRITGPRDRIDIAKRRAEVAAQRRERRRARFRIDPRWGLLAMVGIGVPALAATTDFSLRWGDVARIPAGGTGPVVARMPFERESWNFPGSAFYYLEADPSPEQQVSVASEGGISATGAGMAAPAFARAGSAGDQQRALTCLAQAIYYEAASESDSGQQAVAQVVLNRVKHRAWPGSVCGVVFQGSTRRTGCQFSFTCDGSMARVPSRRAWDKAVTFARAALSGYVHAPAGLATHYHTLAVSPYWAPRLTALTVIGAHRFYTLPGSAQNRRAFADPYTGNEPTRTQVRRSDPQVSDPVDNLPPAPAVNVPGAAPPRPQAQQPSAAPAEPKRSDRLPGGGTVRPEYRDAGKWKEKSVE